MGSQDITGLRLIRCTGDMQLTCGGIKGGWIRIANIDTTQGDQCPSGWSKIMQPKPLCRGSGDAAGCYSTNFINNKTEYNSICGKLRGYKLGSHSAFLVNSNSINAAYLDGVSITVGNPRKHVWSYAVGYTQLQNIKEVNCPCAKHPGVTPPVFVGNHYYCESSSTGISDPLWDGRGCPTGDDCCSTLGAPWFFRRFTEPEKGAVEVRICRDEAYLMKLLYWNKLHSVASSYVNSIIIELIIVGTHIYLPYI